MSGCRVEWWGHALCSHSCSLAPGLSLASSVENDWECQPCEHHAMLGLGDPGETGRPRQSGPESGCQAGALVCPQKIRTQCLVFPSACIFISLEGIGDPTKEPMGSVLC